MKLDPPTDSSDVLIELVAREPIFHRPEHGTSRADFDRMMDATFSEVGASGTCYSRAFVLDELEKRHATGREDPHTLNASDFRCLELAPTVYLLTYTLQQGPRVTRRSTIWRRTEDGWK